MKKTRSTRKSLPDKQPTLRIPTRPNDANKAGDIFGGWLMSQIDIAGAIAAVEIAEGAVVTVAVKELKFIRPLFIYDVASFYAKIIKTGRTSITVEVEVFAQRHLNSGAEAEKISEARLVYVAVSAPGKPRALPLSIQHKSGAF